VVSGRPTPTTVGVTGTGTPLGLALLNRLAGRSDVPRVVAVDATGDPGALSGLGTVVHLAVSYDVSAEPRARRERTVSSTSALLGAARAQGVSRVVLVSSTDVHAAPPPGAVLPLPEDLPLRVDPDSALTGDLLELERLAVRAAADGLEVVLLRAATLVGGPLGPAYDGALLQSLDGPRLLAVRGRGAGVAAVPLRRPAVRARAGGDRRGDRHRGRRERRLAHAARGRGAVRALAARAARRRRARHRGAAAPGAPHPGSSAELDRLLHPVAVQTRRLAEAGWLPDWTAESALQAHLAAARPEAGRGAARTRSAAGATVALVGTAALVRRARRRRGR
jgi:nucleoside-diphosphate-sugar epimerase